MAREHPIIQALQDQLAANRKERDWLETQLRAAIAFYQNGTESRAGSQPRASVAKEQVPHTNGSSFAPREGGLTETAIAIIRERPGILLQPLLDEGVKRVNTDSKHPRDNLRETIRWMVKKGRVDRKPNGEHYFVR